MCHVARHHSSGSRLAHSRFDFALIKYLWHNGAIDIEVYRELVPLSGERQSLPSPPPDRPEMSRPPAESGPVAVVNERRHRETR